MKNTVLLCALAVLAFTACEQHEVFSQAEQALCFEAPVLTPVVKSNGMAIQGTSFEGKDFAVSALYTTEDFSQTDWNATDETWYFSELTAGETVLNSKMTWMTSPATYWPKSGYLHFQAFYPTTVTHNATIDLNGIRFHGDTETDPYELALDGSQVDLLYSHRAADQTHAHCVDAAGLHGVQLTLNHALSSLRFQAATTGLVDSTTQIAIFGIALCNVYHQGFFAQNLTPAIHQNLGTWTPYGPRENYNNVIGSLTRYSAPTASTPIVLPTNDQVDISAAAQVKDLLIMPQSLVESGAFLVIGYMIQQGDNPGLEQMAYVYLDRDSNPDGSPCINLGAFEIGKQYTFTFTFAMDQIHFAPVLSPWVDVEVAPFAL